MTDHKDVAVAADRPAPSAEPGALLAAIVQIARDPAVNVEMFDRLVSMQERAEAKQAERAFNGAMNAVQTEVQPVVRDAENKQTNSRYAKLETVDAAIRPVYTKHGFSLSYSQVEPLVTGNVRIACECAHAAGHSKTYYLEAAADTMGPKGTPTKTALHGLGSTDTYLRRYLACNIFNVVLRNLDDDGNRGGARLINDDQRQELYDLLAETRRDEATFIGRLFAGKAQSVGEVPAGAFEVVKNSLLMVRQAQANKAAAT